MRGDGEDGGGSLAVEVESVCVLKNLFLCVDASSTNRGRACLIIIFSTLTQGLHVKPQ